MGASALAPIEVPSEDRNRTSPFPYGGHRFEFRAVGSSQVRVLSPKLCAVTVFVSVLVDSRAQSSLLLSCLISLCFSLSP
jgi:glutamine synthetase